MKSPIITLLLAVTASPIATGATMVFQAESATTAGSIPFVTVADTAASDGQYLWLPPSSGNPTDSTATYSLSAPSSASYTLYLRFQALNDGDDSFHLPTTTADGSGNFVDTSETINGLDVGNHTSYQWLNVGTNTVLDGISTNAPNALGAYPLTAGAFEFQIRSREDGLRLDVFVFDTNDSLTIVQLDTLVAIPEPSGMSLLTLTAVMFILRRKNRS